MSKAETSSNKKSTEELAAVFFSYLRSISGKYDENTINTRADLRRKIIEDTKKASSDAVPSASEEDWTKAIDFLAPKLMG